MKNLKVLVLLFLTVGLLSTGCKKDDDGNPATPTFSGTYQLYMENNKVADGTTQEIGLIANVVTIANGDAISLVISGVPVTVGESVAIDNANFSVWITGQNLLLTDGSDELYFAQDGTITRTSSTKVSFQGNCTELFGTTPFSFSGYAESDIYKDIKDPE